MRRLSSSLSAKPFGWRPAPPLSRNLLRMGPKFFPGEMQFSIVQRRIDPPEMNDLFISDIPRANASIVMRTELAVYLEKRDLVVDDLPSQLSACTNAPRRNEVDSGRRNFMIEEAPEIHPFRHSHRCLDAHQHIRVSGMNMRRIVSRSFLSI